ncbi:MAG: tetraacyldisaccharide 4-kinase, partial [Bacteroidota bacterium]
MKYLLLLFSFLYGIITDVRNLLYNKGFWKEHCFNLPVINVGNLTVGGTGKTPHVEYLIRLLKDKYVLTTLSRGYGRKTKGFIIANTYANAETIGDEPYQFYQKFKDEIKVTVGENRVDAINKIQSQHSENELIILDDAF